MNKISIKFSLLIGILSFVIAMAIGEYSKDVSSTQLENNSGKSLVKLSQRVGDILDREMLERYREIKFAATLPALTNESVGKDEKRDLLNKIKNNYNHHEWIGYALPDGTVYAGTKGYLEGKNAKARPWLPAGLKGPYIGDVHDALLLAKLLPNTTGEDIYFSDVAFPVKNKNNKVIGVLCTHLTWQWTRNIIRSIEKEHNVDIFLLSNDGLVLVGPNNSERKNIRDISSNIANEFSNTKATYKTLKWNKEKTYLTAHSISNGFEEYKGFGWKVIVRQPITDAFKVSNDNSNKILFVSLLAAIIGSIIGFILSNKIASPLRKLNTIVNKINKKEEIHFEINNNNDEISILHNTIKDLYINMNKESRLKDAAQVKVNIALNVFDQSIEGILITNKDNEIILINKAFSEITGYSQEDVYGKNPSLLSANPDDKSLYVNLWSDLKNNNKWEGDLSNIRKDGSTYKEHLRISTIKDSENNIVNYVGTFTSSLNT